MMRFSIAFQTLVFLQAIVLGIGLGLVYDVLRTLRTTMPKPGITAACDGIFWTVVLIAGFVFVLTAAQGSGRAYIALGALLGGAFYAIAFSPAVFGGLIRIAGVISGILRKILRIFTCAVLKIHSAWQCTNSVVNKFQKKIVQKVLSFFSKKG